MSRAFLLIGPGLLLASCVAQALAAEPDALAGEPSMVATAGPSMPMPGGEYLLSLGPYGALVWGAYLLGKGVKVTVQIELSERDREIIEKLGKGAA